MNQYTSVGGTTRIHDSNGDLSDDGTLLFSYDYQNRLVRVTNKATMVVIANYKHDALGRRVEKAVTAGATTRHILDGVQVVEEFDGSEVWQARYVYEDCIDQPRCMDRADIADANGNANTTEVLRFHYHQQALGSVTELTQPSGAVVEWVTYDVYGQPAIRNQTGGTVTSSAVGNPYLYTGREFDPESGLFFYRARHYDPNAGRFLQRDPLGFIDGLGPYEYARSDPSGRGDPLGTHSPPRPVTAPPPQRREPVTYQPGSNDAEKRSNLETALQRWNAGLDDKDRLSAEELQQIVNTMMAGRYDGYTQAVWHTGPWVRNRDREGLKEGRCYQRKRRLLFILVILPTDSSAGLDRHEETHAKDIEMVAEQAGATDEYWVPEGASDADRQRARHDAEAASRAKREGRLDGSDGLVQGRHDQEGQDEHDRDWEELENERRMEEWLRWVDSL